MPPKVRDTSRRIPIEALNPHAFAPFGEVIQNPRIHNGQPALHKTEANQGTATKWLDVSHMGNLYATEKRHEAKCVMNMFVCRPRELRVGRLFDVEILERHPYTPQTFVPMGLGREDRETAYLVIVAPTLPTGAWDWQDLDHPGHDYGLASWVADASGTHRELGPPDLSKLKAFIARGDQAVTYGAATWHAPMVALGEKEIEFVVVQYANGRALDDVQEVEPVAQDGGKAFEVDLSRAIAAEKPKL